MEDNASFRLVRQEGQDKTLQFQLEELCFAQSTPKKVAGAEIDGSYKQQTETPMFDYEQHKKGLLEEERNQMIVDGQSNNTPAPVVPKKVQSTTSRRGKRANLLTAAEQQPIPLNLAAASDDKNDGGFAVANLSGPLVKTNITADGKISLTLKRSDSVQVSAAAPAQPALKKQASSTTSRAKKPRARKNAQQSESKPAGKTAQKA